MVMTRCTAYAWRMLCAGIQLAWYESWILKVCVSRASEGHPFTGLNPITTMDELFYYADL